MKTMFIIFAVAIVAMLATLLACVWTANRKHARRQVRQWLAHGRSLAVWFIFGIEVALGLATEIRARIRHRRLRLGLAGNAVYTGQDKTHEISYGIARTPDASITTRFLIYKKGAGTNTASSVNQSVDVVAAQTDVPLGTIADEWDSTKDAGQPPALKLFGGQQTIRVRANAAGLTVGDLVYSVAGGYVDKKSNLTGSSTAYYIGYVVDVPGQVSASAQGDVLEIASCAPVLTTT